jgi:hypothetical protein
VRLLSAALLATFWATSAGAAALKEGKDWRNCSRDDQCVMIEGRCGKTAVNRLAKNEAQFYYAQEEKTTKCVERFWKPKEVVSRCRLGSCETIPKQASHQ